MRVGLVVDAACDLSKAYIRANNIVILPITLHLPGGDLTDNRDDALTARFYAENLAGKGDAGTSCYSAEQIKSLFLSHLVLDYDYVFCMTLASSRSPMHEFAVKASFAILGEYKTPRAQAGVPGPFALRVMDTQNLFAAQGLLAHAAMSLIKRGENPQKIREKLDALIQNTHGYMLPRDLFYLRARAQKKGDRSVGWLGAALGSALDIKPLIKGYRNETGPCAKVRHFEDGAQKCFGYMEARVRAGLLHPALCLSYGGELAVMRALPGYAELMQVCKQAGVEVLESVMSMTGGVNVGPGALAFALAADPHEVVL